MTNTIDVSSSYFKLKIAEIEPSKIKEEKSGAFLNLPYDGENIFRVRRVRLLGRVGELRDMGRWIDCLLVDDTGEIVVRVWGENRELVSDLKENDLIDVFGRIREFRGFAYISPKIIVKLKPDWMGIRGMEIPLLRRHLIQLHLRSTEKNGSLRERDEEEEAAVG